MQTRKGIEPLHRISPQRLSPQTWAAGRNVWSGDIGDRTLEVTDVEVDSAFADAELADQLGAVEGARLVRRFRRYWVDGVPVQTATSYLMYWLVRGSAIMRADTGPGGTPKVLAGLGHAPACASEEIRHAAATIEEAQWLHIEPGDPVLRINRIMACGNGRPVEVARMVLDADVWVLRYDFSL